MNKLKFLEMGFKEEEWDFFSQYPRLFPLYMTLNEFTLSDVQRWHQKFKCSSMIFSQIVKSLHSRICFWNYEYCNKLTNDYKNLEKYNFINFMDNIERYRLIEPLPKYTAWQINEYIIR